MTIPKALKTITGTKISVLFPGRATPQTFFIEDGTGEWKDYSDHITVQYHDGDHLVINTQTAEVVSFERYTVKQNRPIDTTTSRKPAPQPTSIGAYMAELAGQPSPEETPDPLEP